MDMWREHIKKYRLKNNQDSRESRLKANIECPYKKLRTNGSTYPRVGGGFAMGLTLKQLAIEIGFKNYLALSAYTAIRHMPKPSIAVIHDNKNVNIYPSDIAKKISEYVLYSYKKPSKLIKSYEDYFT